MGHRVDDQHDQGLTRKEPFKLYSLPGTSDRSAETRPASDDDIIRSTVGFNADSPLSDKLKRPRLLLVFATLRVSNAAI
jgi:hypothetical protein